MQLEKGNKDCGEQAVAAQDASTTTTVCGNEEGNSKLT